MINMLMRVGGTLQWIAGGGLAPAATKQHSTITTIKPGLSGHTQEHLTGLADRQKWRYVERQN